MPNEKETPKRKYAERFKSDSIEGYLEELEKSYGEAEGKITTQGTAASEQQKKLEALTQQYTTQNQTAQQMQQYYTENKKIIDWYNSSGGQQYLQEAQNAKQAVQQTQIPLSSAELDAMYPGIGSYVEKNLLAPREQQYGQYIQHKLKEQRESMTEQFNDQTRRTNNAMFELMKSALPPERVKDMETFSQRVMDHAEQSGKDPALMARESMEQDNRIASMEAEIAEFKKTQTTLSNYEGMPIGETVPTDELAAFAEPEGPTSDRDVMAAVFADINKEHGGGTVERMAHAANL